MIIREWRARAEPARSDAYPKHFREMVASELRHVEGFLGAHLSQQLLGDEIEFVVLTRWESMDAIRGFAGEDLEQAKVEPGAVAALLSYDDTVRHYDVIEEL
jgi:heme-degrading monooxygenase HmoA